MIASNRYPRDPALPHDEIEIRHISKATQPTLKLGEYLTCKYGDGNVKPFQFPATTVIAARDRNHRKLLRLYSSRKPRSKQAFDRIRKHSIHTSRHESSAYRSLRELPTIRPAKRWRRLQRVARKTRTQQLRR